MVDKEPVIYTRTGDFQRYPVLNSILFWCGEFGL